MLFGSKNQLIHSGGRFREIYVYRDCLHNFTRGREAKNVYVWRGLNVILHLSFFLNRVTKKQKRCPLATQTCLNNLRDLISLEVLDTSKALLLLVVVIDVTDQIEWNFLCLADGLVCLFLSLRFTLYTSTNLAWTMHSPRPLGTLITFKEFPSLLISAVPCTYFEAPAFGVRTCNKKTLNSNVWFTKWFAQSSVSRVILSRIRQPPTPTYANQTEPGTESCMVKSLYQFFLKASGRGQTVHVSDLA